MSVQALNELSWWCSFHLIGWYRKPLSVQLLQVGKEPLDFEISCGELLRGQFAVFDVESDGSLCDVLVVVVNLLCKELGNTFYFCVYHRKYFLFNNN